MKNQEGIYGSIRLNKDKYIKKFRELYSKGFTDSAIARLLKISNTSISKWRNDLGLERNFKYSVKFSIEKFKELLSKGLNYSEIARELGVSSSSIQEFASKNGYKSSYHSYSNKEFSEEEFQIFLGGMLGDSSMSIGNTCINARLQFAHSLEQQNYALWKYEKLKRFCVNPRIEENLDKRTNKIYKRISIWTKRDPLFTKFYYKFYNNKVKFIDKELFRKIEPLGLAVWFMDDGYKHSNSISIATNCFTAEDIDYMIQTLKEKYNLIFTRTKENIMHLSAKSLELFYNLVIPYIHEDCLYKLKWCSLNSVKQGKAIEAVPVLNLQETEEKVKRLEVMPNEKVEAIKSSTKAGHCSN